MRKNILPLYIKTQRNRAFSLVEVLVGVAIIAAALVSILGVYGGLTKLSYRNTSRIQAAFLLQEGVEALHTIRDAGWTANISGLSTSTIYRLAWVNSKWTATTTISLIDNLFDRTVVVSNVNRDANFDITNSGGTIDSNSKKFTVTVSWSDNGATTSQSVDTYLFNTFGN